MRTHALRGLWCILLAACGGKSEAPGPVSPACGRAVLFLSQRAPGSWGSGSPRIDLHEMLSRETPDPRSAGDHSLLAQVWNADGDDEVEGAWFPAGSPARFPSGRSLTGEFDLRWVERDRLPNALLHVCYVPAAVVDVVVGVPVLVVVVPLLIIFPSMAG